TVGRDAAARNILSEYLAAAPEQQGAVLNQLAAQSPEIAERAMGMAAMQNELARLEQVEQARREYAIAQSILESDNPALRLRLADEGGEFIDRLVEMGLIDSEDGIDDDEARTIAQWAQATLSPL